MIKQLSKIDKMYYKLDFDENDFSYLFAITKVKMQKS